ncbi:MAG: nucleoside triphosphate pyrophosphohydrolase [Gammaproteobacteria bacterium]|nr:nucleoside triphosphate pyrophosphohydrolase [Gammaproteobacteria bacterium]
MNSLERLLQIMETLRDPVRGCPWDKEQTYATIVPYTIEEAYEVADAIERSDFDALRSELGDLLFQVVYYCQFAKEEGRFEFEDVARGIADKLIRRHPHVFAVQTEMSIPALHQRWEAMKAEERGEKATGPLSLLDDVPQALPALVRAHKLQKRVAAVGFDWPEIGPVFGKVREELDELCAELTDSPDAERVAEEMGDLLFVMVNLSRHLGHKAEDVLRAANNKFERRFRAIEARLAAEGRGVGDANLAELDAHWDAVKAEENS